MMTSAKTTKSPLLGRDSAVICCGILGGSFYPKIRVLLSKTFTVYIRKHQGASFPLVLLGGGIYFSCQRSTSPETLQLVCGHRAPTPTWTLTYMCVYAVLQLPHFTQLAWETVLYDKTFLEEGAIIHTDAHPSKGTHECLCGCG